MKRAPLAVAFVVTSLAWLGAAVLVAQSGGAAGSAARNPAYASQGTARTTPDPAQPTRLDPAQRKPGPAKPTRQPPRADSQEPRARNAASQSTAASHRAWLDRYCVGCHNTRAPQPAGDPVDLQAASLDDLLPHAATWERVLRKLRVRAMPPQGSPHPSEAEYAGFTTWLSTSLDRAWAARATPGVYVVHRLNRTEYGNAVRDLLGLEVDVTELLPSDGGDFGFDNIAASLKTSPLLLDRYVTAAQRISTMAIGDPAVKPGTTEYGISREFTQRTHVDGLPLGTRGGTVVRHVFPADGEYKLSGRLVRGVEEGYAGVEGNDTPDTFIITVDGEEVYTAPVGGLDDHAVQAKDMNEARDIIDARMTGTVRVTAGPHDVGFTWKERPSQSQDVWEPSLRDSQEVHMIAGLPRLKTVAVEGPYNVTGVSSTPSRDRVFICDPAVRSVRLQADPPAPRSGVRLQADLPSRRSSLSEADSSRRSSPTSAASEGGCASRILTNLARRAYRRPVTALDLEAPLSFYRQARQSGGSFDQGVRAGLARILSSPSFLYRIERDQPAVRPGAAHQVSDIELASRLSFFLWSSIPDDALLNAAAGGRLREPGMLARQVRRMIADPRADALVNNFIGQWLQLRNLEAHVAPDLLLFPDFDDNVRKAFRRETELFFGHIVRNNRSALELMSANYTFLNERLARHYGVPGVYGTRFRKVTLTDPNRFGLLGQGSVLSLTALATRTSPVLRGKYVLSTFLDTPPLPPPPNVPTLEESARGAATAPKTVREQLELHRKSPACASCHRTIDPVGFALENFDPVGRWRSATVEGAPIDASGVLADGYKVDRPAALREAILSRPEAFVTVLTERLLIYALGRGLEPADMPVVRRIVSTAAKSDFRFESIVMGIVESAPFQMRTRLEPAGTVNRVAKAKVE